MSPLTILILSFAMFIIGLLIVVVRRQLLFVLWVSKSCLMALR